MTALALAQLDDDRTAYGLVRPRLVNMCVETAVGAEGGGGAARVQRPALTASASPAGAGPIWGIHQDDDSFNGDAFVTSGGRLIRAPIPAGTPVDEGSLQSSMPTQSAASPSQRAIVSEGILFVYGVTTASPTTPVLMAMGTFADDTSRVLPLFSDVTYLGGRFIYTDQNSALFYWSEIDDAATIGVLNFASADSSPDNLVGCAQLNGQLALLGSESVEWWQPNDDITAPYIRGQGQGYGRGCAAIATIVSPLDNAMFWVGDDRSVYRSGAVPNRISVRGVEEALRRSVGGGAGATAWQARQDGHSWYVLNVPGEGTWAYDISAKQWSEWADSGATDGTFPAPPLTGPWRGAFGITTGQLVITAEGPNTAGLSGDGSGTLYTAFPTTYVDGPTVFARLVSAWLPVSNGRPRVDNVSLQCRSILSTTAAPSVWMRYSDDQGDTYSAWRSSPLFQSVGGDARVVWNRCGRASSPGRQFEFSCSDNVGWAVLSAAVNSIFP
jgi:hypothetical protein